jgi:hypothetical protein
LADLCVEKLTIIVSFPQNALKFFSQFCDFSLLVAGFRGGLVSYHNCTDKFIHLYVIIVIRLSVVALVSKELGYGFDLFD